MKNKDTEMEDFFSHGHKIPDQFFMELDNILLPVCNQSFETLGTIITKFIANEFGAKVKLLHNGRRNIEHLATRFKEYNVKTEIKTTLNLNTAQTIIQEAKNDYQLLIMPSRRRSKLLDRFLVNSVSSKVIPKVKYDTLQIYPKKEEFVGDEEELPEFKHIAVLLPRTERDFRLLFFANALLVKKEGELHVYHISDVPAITPLKQALDSDLIMKERQKFYSLVKGYSKLFSTKIIPHFILGYNVKKAAAMTINENNPDLVIMGQSKLKSRFILSRTLSEHLLDKTKVPILVHHYPEKK